MKTEQEIIEKYEDIKKQLINLRKSGNLTSHKQAKYKGAESMLEWVLDVWEL